MNTARHRKLPGIYWVAVAFSVLVCGGIYFAVRDQGEQRKEARRVAIAKGAQREGEHYCAAWRSDAQEFADCGAALHAYRQCELAFLNKLEQSGDAPPEGVYCEHAKYQFHAQEQKEIQDAMRSPSPGR